VKALATAHIHALDEKARDLLAMKATLEHLVRCCRGDDRPECPILASLAEEETTIPVASSKGQGLAVNRRSRAVR